MIYPKIYTIVQAPLLGQLGEATKLASRDFCRECGRQPPLEIQFLHYSFDYWEGEPLANVADNFAVTPELHRVIETANIKGITFKDMLSTYGDTYVPEEGDPKLPVFSHLSIDTRIQGGPGWWEPVGTCAVCGLRIWDHTESTVKAIVEAHRNEDVPKRTVVPNYYDGQDIFYLDDPGPAIITERFLDLLSANGADQLDVQEAVFIERD